MEPSSFGQRALVPFYWCKDECMPGAAFPVPGARSHTLNHSRLVTLPLAMKLSSFYSCDMGSLVPFTLTDKQRNKPTLCYSGGEIELSVITYGNIKLNWHVKTHL